MGDLFLQAAGTPSAPSPPPRAFFEDFFGSSVPPSSIYLSWFRGSHGPLLMRMLALLLFFFSSGHADFFFLPLHNSSCAVKDDFASGQAVLVNPSLLSRFEKQLKPSYHVGLTVREAAALESSLQGQSEAMSHSMWVLLVCWGLSGSRILRLRIRPSSTLWSPLCRRACASGLLVCSHTAFFDAEAQAVLHVPPACILLRHQ